MRNYAERFAYVGQVGHNRALGISVLDAGPNWSKCALEWREELVVSESAGILASGPIVSLMDVACSVSVWSAVETITSSVTLDLRVDYLRPARSGRRVFGCGECYHVASRIAFVRGVAHDGDPAEPIAYATGRFLYTKA